MQNRCPNCMEEFSEKYHVCPSCGAQAVNDTDEIIHLRPGTILCNRYHIGKTLGYGGFGVTYIAWDERLHHKVAIKEYLPSEFATRLADSEEVTAFSGEKQEQYEIGLKKFIDEGKRLAKFQNEYGIVRIFDCVEENNTAYIIMEYLKGHTLAHLLEHNQTFNEKRTVAMLTPIMRSLEVVHSEGILHRDISPDNIIVTEDGTAKLIDFSASRFATTSYSLSLTVIIKQGYSPEEQYRSKGVQGPYTDVYSLAATIYKMVTGITPPDALKRRSQIRNGNKDPLIKPRTVNKTLSPSFETAILNALNVAIEDRTPDIKTLLKELRPSGTDNVKRRDTNSMRAHHKFPVWLKAAFIAMAVLVVGIAALFMTGVLRTDLISSQAMNTAETVIVPDIEGRTKDDALKVLSENGLNAVIDGYVSSDFIPAGIVVLQRTGAGASVDRGSDVYFVISSGPKYGDQTDYMYMPYLIGKNVNDAIEELEALGMTSTPMVTTDKNATEDPGIVVFQNIKVGEKIRKDTTIALLVAG